MKLNINIEKKEFTNKVLFSDVDFELNEGIYMLCGLNGSGKTTLLNMIYQIEKYDGIIKYNDLDISKLDVSNFRTNICSYNNQSNNLFDNLSLSENIKILSLDDEKKDKLLEILNLKEIYKSKKNISSLSGGERQKSQLLINLLGYHDIILLDEPENNLDKKSIVNLIDFLKTLNKITIISSHSLKEFIDLDNMGEIEISNQKITLKKDLVQINSNNINDRCDMKKLNKKKIRFLKRKNFSNRIFLMLIMVIVLAVSMYCMYGLSLGFEALTYDMNRGEYKDNVLEIYAPVSNDLYTAFGEKDWVKKTPFYFTDKDLDKIKNDDRVSYVNPIADTPCSLCSYYTPVKQDQLGPNFKIEDLNFGKYNIEHNESEGIVTQINYENMILNKKESQNLPIASKYKEISKIVYGEFPKDNTNEVMIDIYYAMYLAQEENLNTLDELIGKTVGLRTSTNLEGVQNESDYQGIEKYKISGIYTPNLTGDDIQESQVIGSYNENQHIVRRNSPWLLNYANVENDEGQEYKEFMYSKYESFYDQHNISKKSSDTFDSKTNYYPGFYIELKSDKDMESFIRDIETYDKYIEIGSNYTNEHSTIGKQMSRYISINLLKILSILVISVIIIWFLLKLLLNEIKKNKNILTFYGFNNNEIQRYIKGEINSTKYSLIFIYTVSISYNIYLGVVQHYYMINLLNIIYATLILISLMIILIIEKRRNYG